MLDLRRASQSVLISLLLVGVLCGIAYLGHLLLAAAFGSVPVFLSLFGLAVGLAALCIYNAETSRWYHSPRISIKLMEEVDKHE